MFQKFKNNEKKGIVLHFCSFFKMTTTVENSLIFMSASEFSLAEVCEENPALDRYVIERGGVL